MSRTIGHAREAADLLAPAPAVALGLLVATGHGAPWTAYLPNVAALFVGAAMAAWAHRASTERLARLAPSAAFLAIASTLAFAGLDGVHRWLPLGPLMLNASAALAPWLLLGCLAERRGVRIASLALTIATQLVHYAQPDAGQATALALGALPLVLDRAVIDGRLGVPCAALLVALAAATWAEPDPLAPVEHVERILFLAAARGPLWIAAVISAGAAMLVPLVWPQDRRAPLAVRASGVLYIAATFAVTFAGNFPVPAFGAGAAPLLGWYAMLAVCRSERE